MTQERRIEVAVYSVTVRDSSHLENKLRRRSAHHNSTTQNSYKVCSVQRARANYYSAKSLQRIKSRLVNVSGTLPSFLHLPVHTVRYFLCNYCSTQSHRISRYTGLNKAGDRLEKVINLMDCYAEC